DIGMAFGPDGNLYVSSSLDDRVLRFDAASGALVDAFVPARSGGLDRPEGLVFHDNGDDGDDGFLYVASGANDLSIRYDAATGRLDRQFVLRGSGGLHGPTGIAFGPDGDLYVSSSLTDEVLRFDGSTGDAKGRLVARGSGGLDYPTSILFSERFRLRIEGPD